MKVLFIILLAIILINYFLINILAIYRDIKIESFVCKSCLTCNRIRYKKCKNCGNELKPWLGYRSLFFGRKDCKNSTDKSIRKSRVKGLYKIDTLIIWVISIILSVILGIVLAKLITFI